MSSCLRLQANGFRNSNIILLFGALGRLTRASFLMSSLQRPPYLRPNPRSRRNQSLKPLPKALILETSPLSLTHPAIPTSPWMFMHHGTSSQSKRDLAADTTGRPSLTCCKSVGGILIERLLRFSMKSQTTRWRRKILLPSQSSQVFKRPATLRRSALAVNGQQTTATTQKLHSLHDVSAPSDGSFQILPWAWASHSATKMKSFLSIFE